MNRQHVLIIVVLGLFLVICAVATWYIAQAPVREEVATDATATLVDSEETPYVELSGDQFTFSELRGQIRIVTVWASWVPGMADELVALDALAGQYKDSDVVVVAVNRKEPAKRIAAFLDQLPPLPNLQMVIDETDAFYQAAGGYAMPETRLYDAAGTIALETRGPVDTANLARAVETLLE